jgi:hypothetical protein
MTELERALQQLGLELDFPAAPDLGSRVRARIGRRRGRRALVGAVALAVLALAVAMAVPDARSSILRFFHLGAATIERVETLPPARERPLAAGLGPALTRKEAEARAGFTLILSGTQPRRFYARPGLLATLLQYDGKAVLLAELDGDQMGFAKKFVSPGTTVEPAPIGSFGLWLGGGRHVLVWEAPVTGAQQIQPRLAGNVLIWTEAGRTFRLEGALDEGQMLKLGRQITR